MNSSPAGSEPGAGPTIGRRTLIGSAAAAALMAGISGCAGLPLADGGALPTADELWDAQLRLAALGPRYTGNDAHLALIDWMSAELAELGLHVASDDTRFTRWTETGASLALGATEEPVEVASTYPYSRPTGAEGVSADLVHGGRAGDPDLSADMAGRIVFLDAPAPSLPFGQWYPDPQPYGAAGPFPQSISHAAAQVVTAPDLAPFAARGARGVILGWSGVSEAQAANQYLPFNRPMQPIPGLWVGPEAAVRLREAARAGQRARLTLAADLVENAVSRTIYAELPGATAETVIVNTHSDGPNAVEENGPIGLIALARRLAARPRAERRRSVVFVMASGHFVGPQVASTGGFLERHREILRRTVAALAVEHLGAMEWVDRPDGSYGPTGRPELSFLFTRDPGLARLALAVARQAGDPRGAVALPRALPHFFGEGRPLARAGVPTLGFIPLPTYLLSAAPDGHIGKLDPRLMHLQLRFLAALMDRMLTFQA